MVRLGSDQRVLEPGPSRSRPTPPGCRRIIARTWFGKALGLLVPMIRDLPEHVLLSSTEPMICTTTVRPVRTRRCASHSRCCTAPVAGVFVVECAPDDERVAEGYPLCAL